MKFSLIAVCLFVVSCYHANASSTEEPKGLDEHTLDWEGARCQKFAKEIKSGKLIDLEEKGKKYSRANESDGSLSGWDDFAELITCAHNSYRSRAGMTQLYWKSKLASRAYRHAQHMGAECKLSENTDPIIGDYGNWNTSNGFGENGFKVAMMSKSKFNPALALQAVGHWFSEAAHYQYPGKHVCFSACEEPGEVDEHTEHFTQMMWADSTAIGCAYSKCATPQLIDGVKQDVRFVHCEYYKPGNLEGFQAFSPHHAGTINRILENDGFEAVMHNCTA